MNKKNIEIVVSCSWQRVLCSKFKFSKLELFESILFNMKSNLITSDCQKSVWRLLLKIVWLYFVHRIEVFLDSLKFFLKINKLEI